MKQHKIIFSPTGGTEKIANAITSNWTDTETIDLSNMFLISIAFICK